MTAVVALATLAACSGGKDSTAPKAIDIALSAATLSVVQGANGSVTATITRTGGFTGDVAIAVDGLPTGVTVAPVTIGAAATTGVITITAAATAVPATTTLTVRATGTGVTAKTAPLALTVTAAPVPAYTLALAPTAVTVAQGGTGTIGATLTRTGGFTGAVTFAVEGLPTGVTGAFSPNNTTTSASTLTLTAAAGATLGGPTTITVRSTATGQTDKTATFQLTITAPTPASYTLAVTPATVTVAPSATATANVALTRTGGFAGAVTFAVEGLPAGVTGAFNPNNTTTDASVLTLTAAANAAAGTSTITVRGTATGQPDKTATFQLTVSAPAGSYTLAVTPATVGIVQGATATANVALTRTGGFAGAVTFAVEGLPTGVTGAFAPNNTTTNASVLTLTAAANATAGGPTTVTVRGTATGQTDKTATFQLNVTAAGGFTLAATSPVTVQQGATGTSAITITRTNGFAGAVTLTATGLPNGVTAAFNPAAPTTNTSTLTFTASATATVGQATVTVRGNSGTLAEQTATITLNVTAAAGGSGNTTWEFCTASQTPIWLAIQDGVNGTWTRVTPTGTKFQFNITQAKSGIAYVAQTGTPFVGSASRTFAARLAAEMQQELLMRNRPSRANAYAAGSLALNFELSIVYGTQAELNAQGTTQCLPGAGKTVNGTVANVSATQSASISLGSASGGPTGASTSFTLTDVPDGALDLIAGRTTTTINGANFTIALDKLIIRRGVNAVNNSTLPVLDFGAAEAFDPAQANITIGNLGSEVGFPVTSYFTAAGSGTAGAALSSFNLPGAGPFKYYGVPAAKQAAGDLHVAIAFAFPNQQSTDQARFAGLYFKDPTDRTVTLGAALTAPTVSVVASAPYARLRATGPLQATYNKFVNISYTQGTAARGASITASEGYLTGLANYDFTIPDFTAVAGWDNNWGLKAGASTAWTVIGYTFTGTGFGSTAPLEGATFQGATRNGTITP